jgi:hypothetical protein
VETQHVLALQHVIPFQALAEFIREVLEGQIEVRGHVVSFRTGEALHERQSAAAEGRPYEWGSIAFLDISSPWAQAEHPWSALTFSIQSDSVGIYLRHLAREDRGIDQELRTHLNPYDGLSGLVKFFARGPDKFGNSHSRRFEVLAPLHARFSHDSSRFDEELQIGIHVGARGRSVISQIGYFAADADGQVRSGTLSLADARFIEDATAGKVIMVHPFPAVGSVTLFLCVGSHCVDKMTLIRLPAHAPNPRVEAFRTIDPDLAYFQAGLRPSIRSSTDAFEQSVARLFTFLGFTVDVLGPDKKLSDGVDCLAYTGTMTLAVECTTGSIDAGGKLGKLVSRARAIAAAAGGTVLAVLATSLHRERIAMQEMSRASEDGIAVLAREELDHLFGMCLENAPLASAAEYVASQIPPRRPSESISR